jgi:hypothetical protein
LSLNRAVRYMVLAETQSEAAIKLSSLGMKRSDAEELTSAYFEAVSAVIAGMPERVKIATRNFIRLNAYRLNQPLSQLYRPVLVRAIRRAIDSDELVAIPKLIEHYKEYAIMLTSDVEDARAPLERFLRFINIPENELDIETYHGNIQASLYAHNSGLELE